MSRGRLEAPGRMRKDPQNRCAHAVSLTHTPTHIHIFTHHAYTLTHTPCTHSHIHIPHTHVLAHNLIHKYPLTARTRTHGPGLAHLQAPAILRGTSPQCALVSTNLQLPSGSNSLCNVILKFKVSSPLWKPPSAVRPLVPLRSYCQVRTS